MFIVIFSLCLKALYTYLIRYFNQNSSLVDTRTEVIGGYKPFCMCFAACCLFWVVLCLFKLFFVCLNCCFFYFFFIMNSPEYKRNCGFIFSNFIYIGSFLALTIIVYGTTLVVAHENFSNSPFIVRPKTTTTRTTRTTRTISHAAHLLALSSACQVHAK